MYLQEISAIPKSRIAYVDETGVDTYLHRKSCWLKRGQKVIGHISGKKYHRVGIVAAQIDKDVIAPLQYEGTMNSELFENWFENRLLRDLPADSVVVMDNASFHRKSRLTQLVNKRQNGHKIIFLPPYSPELNPIENFWAALKARLRRYLRNFNSFDEALCYCLIPI